MSILRLLAVLAGLAFAGPAFAHAVLLSATPGEGTALKKAPRKVELRFNEPVQALVLRLIDARGATHDLAPRSTGELVDAALPEDLPEGVQILSYRVVSLDGHPVGASLSFSIGTPSLAPAFPVENASRAIWIWATKALDLALQLGGAGMAFFFAFLSPTPPTSAFRKVGSAALCAGMALAFLSMGLQGLDLLGLPLESLAQLTPWRTAATTPFALVILFELMAFAFAATALRAKHANLAKTMACGSLLCVGCARAVGGHAALADPEWLMRPAVFLHTAAAAIWAGALPPLLWLALTNAKAFPTALRRFSTVALATVEVLLIMGCVIAAVQTRNLSALVDTAYGRLLAVKLGLVVLLLLLALWNRRGATPRVMAEEKRATRLIAGSMAIEIALLLGIFGVVAGWRFTPPPRALIEARSAADLEIRSGHTRVLLKAEPGRAGENRLKIELFDHASGALSASEVTLTLAAPWLGIEPRVLAAQRSDDGGWLLPSVYLPAAGEWAVTVEALVSDFEKLNASGTLQIAR